MLFYGLLAFSGFLAIWLLRAQRAWLYAVSEDSLSLLNVLLDPLDDEQKLARMEAATPKLLLSLLRVLFLFILAFILAFSPFLVFPYLGLSTSSSVGWSTLALSIGASLPFFIPLPKSASAYSEPAKLLHRLILNNYAVGWKLYRSATQKNRLASRPDFVIISGLARAGTTSLMNQLAALTPFKSLHYGHMPFLLSPRLWARFYRAKKGETKERSHKDGIKIGLSSHEALEEYFFKAQSRDAYINDSSLEEHRLSPTQHQEYLAYQALVRQSEQDVYLAKNNNFLLRYASLRALNPDFKMIVLFRSPLLHAASLLEKHRQYQSLQSEDPFVLEYMNWLGHHEFGQNHLPFAFAESQPPTGNQDDLNYWLHIWCNYYRRALSLEGLIFVDYQKFCAEPKATLEAVLKEVKLEAKVPALASFDNKRSIDASLVNQDLLKEANEIHQALSKRALI